MSLSLLVGGVLKCCSGFIQDYSVGEKYVRGATPPRGVWGYTCSVVAAGSISGGPSAGKATQSQRSGQVFHMVLPRKAYYSSQVSIAFV